MRPSSWCPDRSQLHLSGLWGTYFWIDPAERLIAIQLIQLRATSTVSPVPFRNLTYGAFLVPDRGAPISATAAIDQVSLDELVGKYDFGQSSSFAGQDESCQQLFGIGANIERQAAACEFSGLSIIRPRPRLD